MRTSSLVFIAIGDVIKREAEDLGIELTRSQAAKLARCAIVAHAEIIVEQDRR